MRTRALNAWTDDAGAVKFVERLDDGRVVLRASGGHLVMFLRMADITREFLRTLRSSRFVSGIEQQDKWLRVVWRDRRARDGACEWFRERGVQTFEGDLPAVRRWSIDADVEVQRPRLAYLDIETCARVPISKKELSRVLCWTLIAEDGRVITGMLEQDTDADEGRLLAELWRALDDFDQVAAWNGDGFDFPVIFARSAKHGLRVDARRWLWLDHMEVFRRFNTAAESGAEKQSMALQSVAMAVLGEGKLPDFTYDRIFPAWEAGGEEREKLLAYNTRDVELMRRIEQRTGFIDLLYTLCSVTGTFPDTRGVRPMPQVENFVMRLAQQRGVRFETMERKRGEDGEPVEPTGMRGAFVMDPQTNGIVRERVHVADFSAMYPSIVQSWNMSPETLLPRPEAPSFPAYLSHLAAEWKPPPRPDYVAESGIGAYFDQRTRGLLPEVLDTAIALRKKWNDRKATFPPQTPEWVEADRLSTAYKVFANSVFGVASSPVSRIHSHEVGESITQTGVWLIKQTMQAAQERGLRVIYGDTDSLFVVGCSDEEFAVFVKWCNDVLYPRLLAERGCKDNRIKLAYEKAFERVVFISAKRYAARWAHYKGTLPDARTKPEVKGLEYRRGDSCKLARTMQAEIVDLLMGGGILRPRDERCVDDPVELHEVVKRWRSRVLEEPLALDDVVLSKRLSRQLKEYAQKIRKDGTEGAQPPHVRVAKILHARGDALGEGARVAYFVTDGAAKPAAVAPAADWAGECDRFAVWEDQVWPPAERVLAAAYPRDGWAGYARARPARARRPAGGLSAAPPTPGPPPTSATPLEAPTQGALFSLDPPAPGGRGRGRRPIGGAGGTR